MSEKQSSVPHVIAILGVVAIVIMSLWIVKGPDTDDKFSIEAEGRIFAKPDIAEINLGVHTENKATAELATKDNVEKMNKVVDAIKKAGVEEKDFKTIEYKLYPNYNYTENRGRELTGWSLNQTLKIKIRNLDSIGDVIAKATAAGANEAGNISFTIDDPDELRKQAREEAIEKAKEKAKEISKATGMKLGKIVDVVERVDNGYEPKYYAMEAYGIGGGGDVPAPSIETGENEIVVYVTLVYEVE